MGRDLAEPVRIADEFVELWRPELFGESHEASFVAGRIVAEPSRQRQVKNVALDYLHHRAISRYRTFGRIRRGPVEHQKAFAPIIVRRHAKMGARVCQIYAYRSLTRRLEADVREPALRSGTSSPRVHHQIGHQRLRLAVAGVSRRPPPPIPPDHSPD